MQAPTGPRGETASRPVLVQGAPTAESSPHGAQFVQGTIIAGLAFPNASITTRKEFATFIEGIMNNPTAPKPLNNNRTAYWHTATGTIVIRNLGADDCGTAFRPDAGQLYYTNLN
jgi:hypothetical protein